jgi:ribA/ribD-fused uncharacterized protein
MKITEKYIFFLNGTFSNWHTSHFKKDEIWYNCVEQYMMHQKALHFNDKEIADKIIKSKYPNVQKALGREVRNFDDVKWDLVCQDIVFLGCLEKFKQNPNLKKDLLFYGNGRQFVEAADYDPIWGIGMDEEDEGIENPKNWKGKNYLGKVIDRVYNILNVDI